MANFNQSPLGQTSLAITAVTLTLGNAADTAVITTDTTSYVTDASSNGSTVYAKRSAVGPQWRRESKVIRSRE
jgi:hypothetical protein